MSTGACWTTGPKRHSAGKQGWNIREQDPRALALERAFRYIDEHLDHDLSLKQVAAVANYSPHHFHRLFRRVVGESLHGYVRRLRIEHGAFSLRTGEKPVGEVAVQSGFADHETFTRIFRRAFALPPRRYREEADVDGFHRPDGIEWIHEVRFPGARCAAARLRGSYRTMPLPTDEESPWRRLCTTYDVDFTAADCYGVAWDDPIVTQDEVIRYDAGVWHADFVADPYRIPVVDLAAGTYVCARWHGPAEMMTPVYHHLIYSWSREQGRRVDPRRPPFERFVHDVAGTGDGSTVTVNVYVPLGGSRM